MPSDSGKRLGDLLVEAGAIRRTAAETAAQRARQTDRVAGRVSYKDASSLELTSQEFGFCECPPGAGAHKPP